MAVLGRFCPTFVPRKLRVVSPNRLLPVGQKGPTRDFVRYAESGIWHVARRLQLRWSEPKGNGSSITVYI